MATSGDGQKVHKLPQIVLNNKKITVIKGQKSLLKQNFKKVLPFKEDVIYESRNGDFLKSAENICIVNRLNLATNSRRTLVRRAGRPNEVLKSSDDVVNLIGQESYDLVFSALCSVISVELKVRGILALLTSRKFDENSTQTASSCVKKYVDTTSQTDENCMDIFSKLKQRKRVKRSHLTAYVVKDDEPVQKTVKKVIIKPESFDEITNKTDDTTVDGGGSTLPSLTLHDEDSNASIGNMSSLSINTLPNLLENPDSLLNNIQNCTEPYKSNYCPTTLTMLDGTKVTIQVKPEDDLHIATSDILNTVSLEHQRKLKLLQAYFDWKYCLQRDEDGNLPLHNAVNTGDMELLRRQCLVLKIRKESVDVLAGNMTALQMSLYQKNAAATALLLQFGADPLKTDAENRTCVHLAAEEPTDHLVTIINHCRSDPMSIIRENEELWKAGLESKTKELQAVYLLDKISQLTDNSGYTPLMLASKLGIFENVKILLEMAPLSVNLQMPSNGNTALYLAVSAACIDATNKGNLRKAADKFMQVVGKLVESGADPALENHMGHSVNLLLQECNIGDLSLLIANKMTAINCQKSSVKLTVKDSKYSLKVDTTKSYEDLMLIKDKDGNIVKEVKQEKGKPIILENIRVDAKIVDNSKLVVNKCESNFKTDVKTEDKFFLGTFRNFIRKEKESKTFSQVDLTKSNSMIVLNDTKRVRKGKVIDATPAKVMKIKEEKDVGIKSGSSRSD